ncbi:uncharacterized protein VP01_1477g1 [Puccinia sorghi]|uniref:Reverse transcriptase Ty1/copia-type domain-containing protein n=1 Tax=Puccinia sorghi TaxID=27349 RepID=A0A0L6VJR6_9BASI|nr:uncharacterized protein VP01_1477g1 [Puccinia sorghi]
MSTTRTLTTSANQSSPRQITNQAPEIEKELNSIERHSVWDNHWEEPPNPLNTTWVFRFKENTHSDPLKFKSRLCVQGFNQLHSVDYLET